MCQRSQLHACPVRCTAGVVTSTNGGEGPVSLHTRRDRVAEIVALAKRERPYEVPGVSARPIIDGNPDYLAWITQETAPNLSLCA